MLKSLIFVTHLISGPELGFKQRKVHEILVFHSSTENYFLKVFNRQLWRRKWQPTPVFLPGKSHGQRKLVGYSSQGAKSQRRLREEQARPEGPRAFDGRAWTVAEDSQLSGLSHQI